jgi:hypothetical protein
MQAKIPSCPALLAVFHMPAKQMSSSAAPMIIKKRNTPAIAPPAAPTTNVSLTDVVSVLVIWASIIVSFLYRLFLVVFSVMPCKVAKPRHCRD